MKRDSFVFAFIGLCLFVAPFSFAGEWLFVDETFDSGKASSWTFAVICDTRGDNNNTTAKSGINDVIIKLIARSVADEKCDLVIFPGDMINGWCQNGSTTYAEQFENWKRAMGPVYDAGIEVYTVRGNHEDGPLPYPEPPHPYPYNPSPDPALKAAYIETFKGDLSEYGLKDIGPEGEEYLTYSFEHENALFIGLYEYVRPHRVNQAWLDEQLANNNKPYVFVFGHEPAFEVNHVDCLALYTDERNAFWESISKAGCQIYFCGHDHFYNRARVQDKSGSGTGVEVQQVLAGSCGAPFPTDSWDRSYNDSSVKLEYFNDTDFGYVLVTVYEDHADVEWRALIWTPEDEFTITAPALDGAKSQSDATAATKAAAASGA